MNTQFPRFYSSGNPQVDTKMREAQALTIRQVQESKPANTKSTCLNKLNFVLGVTRNLVAKMKADTLSTV